MRKEHEPYTHQSIGVRDLKAHASAIVREVREAEARYVVTYRGAPVGLLVPYPQTGVESYLSDEPSAWDELERLGREIGRGWKSKKSSAELLSEMRR